ncbi:SH2 domain containing 3Cb [Pholidichthys leucotaenia]
MEQPQPAPASARPLPVTPTPSWASPLTSALGTSFSETSVNPVTSSEPLSNKLDLGTGKTPSANGCKPAPTQDLYVVMEPISDLQTKKQRGVACRQEASGTADITSQEVDDSHQNVIDSGGEYVKFSKEKFWLDPPSEELRKQLEEELKLSGDNLKSHAWYHGCIPWEVSESLVLNQGDFLVRDSQSCQGHFVLTCRWEQRTLHLLIRKTALQSSDAHARLRYSLDSNAFDSLPALVHFYVGSRVALTRWSAAQIHQPVNRTLPLSFLETTFCTATSSSSRQEELKTDSVAAEERVCRRRRLLRDRMLPPVVSVGLDFSVFGLDEDECWAAGLIGDFISDDHTSHTPEATLKFLNSVVETPSASHRSPAPGSSPCHPPAQVPPVHLLPAPASTSHHSPVPAPRRFPAAPRQATSVSAEREFSSTPPAAAPSLPRRVLAATVLKLLIGCPISFLAPELHASCPPSSSSISLICCCSSPPRPRRPLLGFRPPHLLLRQRLLRLSCQRRLRLLSLYQLNHQCPPRLWASQLKNPCSGREPSVTPSPPLTRHLDATARPLPYPSITLEKQHLHTPQNSFSDADGSCYTELFPGPQSYVEKLWAEEGPAGIDPLRAENRNVYFPPVVETVSCFKPCSYQSSLMPRENKPLEVGILRRVKELLAEVDPRTAAKHITKADCMVARILEVTAEDQRMMGVSSGMELLTLPHGQQLRLDLLERFQSMAIMLAVDVLGCTGTTEERAGLLHKIIQIAAELKSTMGNMFGFAAVMRTLELPQVSRLEQTWTALRQRHTEGAILYEKTLRPFMKSLNDGRENCPLSSTTFPHVLPLLTLLEKSVAVCEGTEPWETAEVGVDVVMFHLGAARTIAQLGGIYCSNAESKLQGFHEQPEVLELFLTDFQMRLLWGSRGAEENQALRYAKFDQVLTALSNRLEPPAKHP